MFTGIIETVGEVKEISSSGANKTYWIQSRLSTSLKIDESLSHNGVCLTIEEINGDRHRVTAIAETLKKTNLRHWHPGTPVNLEKSLLPLDRLDGHFVQGHVDTVAVCQKITDQNGSFNYQFGFPGKHRNLIIEKGSISLNGISLTVFDVKKKTFKVSIIPYTYQHTNVRFLREGDEVNIEFDLIGKYVLKKMRGYK